MRKKYYYHHIGWLNVTFLAYIDTKKRFYLLLSRGGGQYKEWTCYREGLKNWLLDDEEHLCARNTIVDILRGYDWKGK